MFVAKDFACEVSNRRGETEDEFDTKKGFFFLNIYLIPIIDVFYF